MTRQTNSAHVLKINSCPQNSILKLIWEELGRNYPPSSGHSVLIYGAGKFTKRLLRLVVPLPGGPLIAGIVDDNAKPGQTMAGHPVLKPHEIEANRFSAVLLGTDYHEDIFASQCTAAYGATCPMIRYSQISTETMARKHAVESEGIPEIFRPSQGDPFIDISTIWETAYGLMKHHECNDFKDNLLLAIAMNIKPENAERVTEYGFALRQLSSIEGRLLDIGSSDSMLPSILADKGFEVSCLDPIAKQSSDTRIKVIPGDIRKTDIPNQQFDAITCISTLEHIGIAGRYGISEADPSGQVQAMQEMHRLLKLGGRLLLTVPFGKYAILPLNRVYLRRNIMDLKGSLRCCAEEYYCIDRDGSYHPATAQEADESDLRLDGYYALGCFVFERNDTDA